MQIDIDHVTKQFGPATALADIDLRVAPGERIALVGPNGSGKTTLLRSIMGMLGCDGDIEVGGYSPFDQRQHVSGKLAYVPQIAPNIAAPAGRLVDLICATRAMERRRVAEICTDLGFDFETHADKPFRALSGGMKQKLLVALALAAEPDLLVMDEPTASLDAEARHRFFERCARLADETTIILCSHRLEEIRHLVDRVVALEDGRLVADGPLETFVSELGRAAIEVRIDQPDDQLVDWLGEAGFRDVSANRWVNFVPWEAKLRTVQQLLDRADGRIDDLTVQDRRELDLDGPNDSQA
jgi:ABC-2 type transport system ATP-binding protein